MWSKKLILYVLAFSVLQFLPINVSATSPRDIVINEVAWAGSIDSSNDEWIELYNNTSMDIDLTGWKIVDSSSSYTLSGLIQSHSYYLIEDNENSVQPRLADKVVNISLLNSGEILKLVDSTGIEIDLVNPAGSAWAGGSTSNYASMERINPLDNGSDNANWLSTKLQGQATASGGSAILGSPGMANSVSTNPNNPGSKPTCVISTDKSTYKIGDDITVTAMVKNAENLIGYGFEFTYDQTVLSFVSAEKGGFISNSEKIETSFNSGITTDGNLLVAEAQMTNSKEGRSGENILFTIHFKALAETDGTKVSLTGDSFFSDISGDKAFDYSTNNIVIQSTDFEEITGLVSAKCSNDYSICLSWDSLAGITYEIKRLDQTNQWISIGTVNDGEFVDKDGVVNGGDIIPGHKYQYRVGLAGTEFDQKMAAIEAIYTDGITGDNNRSGRVDGRDLERLAKVFGVEKGEQLYAPLVDTSYDGRIDGEDLIDLGLNFAKSI